MPVRPSTEWRDAQRVTSKFTQAFELGFAIVSERIQSEVTLGAIAEAVRDGDAGRVLNAIPEDVWFTPRSLAEQRVRKQIDDELLERVLRELGIDPTAPLGLSEKLQVALAEVAVEQGKKTAGGIRRGFSFDVSNPYTTRWIKAHAGQLVALISEQTRESIRRVIQTAHLLGDSPIKTAQQLKTMVGLLPRETTWVRNHQNRLIAQGLAPTAVRRSTEGFVKRVLRERGERIARTEVIRANEAGRLHAWRVARDDGLIDAGAHKRWQSGVVEPTCRICRDLHGQVVPLDSSFQSNVLGKAVPAPPAHPHCRCSTSLKQVGELEPAGFSEGRPVAEFPDTESFGPSF